jgi:hypothetical protein
VNILITNIQLTVPGGTVSYVADLAPRLRSKGFNVEIFTYRIGMIGNDLKKAGINVVNNLNRLKNIPDIIHAHHNPTTMDVLIKFRDTPVIFFLHDKTSLFDRPLKNRRILKHVAVDFNCLDRFIKEGAIEKRYTKVIYNWVDTNKFRLRNHFPDKPQSALVFSNYATTENHYRIIAAACKRAGLPLHALGEGMGTAVKNPEDILGQYDLVFAKAKAAIEAIATGAGVIVCDYAGFGEMVSQLNITHLRRFNFGRKTLTRKWDVDLIITEINKFNCNENRLNALTIRNEASFEKTLEEITMLYRDVIGAYREGERGPDAGIIKTRLISFAIKSYFFFSATLVFKQLSKLKYKIKNRLKHKY